MAANLKKVKASMMNAIHDLPLLVARDEGYFRDQGLDVEILRTPGSGQRNSDHQALRELSGMVLVVQAPAGRPAAVGAR